jgi:hypothetical protein
MLHKTLPSNQMKRYVPTLSTKPGVPSCQCFATTVAARHGIGASATHDQSQCGAPQINNRAAVSYLPRSRTSPDSAQKDLRRNAAATANARQRSISGHGRASCRPPSHAPSPRAVAGHLHARTVTAPATTQQCYHGVHTQPTNHTHRTSHIAPAEARAPPHGRQPSRAELRRRGRLCTLAVAG